MIQSYNILPQITTFCHQFAKKSFPHFPTSRSKCRKTWFFRAFFEILLDESNYPLLYHCTAGKDRTGFATLLLLAALGVNRQTIIEDYLLTNDYLNKFFCKEMEAISAKNGFDLESVKPILIADEIYIQGAFDAIEEHFGTVENYLEKALKIGREEIEKLKRILVLK